MRAADPQHRTIQQFIQDEIVAPLGVEFTLGMPSHDVQDRVVPLRSTPISFVLANTVPQALLPRFVSKWLFGDPDASPLTAVHDRDANLIVSVLAFFGFVCVHWCLLNVCGGESLATVPDCCCLWCLCGPLRCTTHHATTRVTKQFSLLVNRTSVAYRAMQCLSDAPMGVASLPEHPLFRSSEFPSFNGVTNAPSLAKVSSVLSMGGNAHGVQLLSPVRVV